MPFPVARTMMFCAGISVALEIDRVSLVLSQSAIVQTSRETMAAVSPYDFRTMHLA